MKRNGLILITLLVVSTQGITQIVDVPNNKYSIQVAIDTANNGDTILVGEDTYYENIDFRGKAITVASQFLIDADPSHISNTILDGSQPGHPDTASVVLMISGEDTTSVLCGFTITGGTGTVINYETMDIISSNVKAGGGILVEDGGCRIEHNIIRNNTLESEGQATGAGIACYFGANEETNTKRIIIGNNEITNNRLESGTDAVGGGIFIWTGSPAEGNTGSILVSDNLVHQNSMYADGAYGSGISLGISVPTINGDYEICNNIISDNELEGITWDHGSGLYIYFWNNEPDLNPGPMIYNNIIAGNSAESEGGGIGIYAFHILLSGNISPKPVLINNTVVDNSAANGPGLWCYSAKPVIINNIFWDILDNPSQSELLISYSQNHQYNNNIQALNNLTNGDMNDDPRFLDNDYNLDDESPCIGAGIPFLVIDEFTFTAPAYDIYGNPRPDPVDDLVDIGAVESSFQRAPGSVGLTGAPGILIYPNPTYSELIINSGSSELFYIHITHLNGQLLYQGSMDQVECRVDLSSFEKGIYLITIRSKDFVTTRKIVKL